MRELAVLVVDDGPLVRQALLRAGAPRLAVLGPVPDAASALAAAEAHPDIVMVALERADDRGTDTVRLVHEGLPGLPVLAVSGGADPGSMAEAIRVGACGILTVPFLGGSLRSLLECALAGELILPDVVLAAVVGSLQQVRWLASEERRFASLTVRERQVLDLVADGTETVEIARRLGITVLTVQSHVKNILAKLGVHSKVDAVRVAWRCGVAIPA